MILVAGGTGRLGTLVVRRLIDRGVDVRVLTREAANAVHLGDDVDVVVGDVRDREVVATAVEDVDLVVSVMHGFVGPRGISPATVDRDGNINLVDAAAATNAAVILLSVVGASADSPMELFRMKHAAEQHLLNSSAGATVVRSTAFMELWIELLRRTSGRSGRPLVFGRGDNPINFVSVTDVAALVDRVVADDSARGAILEIGGPENVTFNELARAVQDADGRTGSPRHVPPAMLRLTEATVGRVNPQAGRQARAALAMDSNDLAFDGAKLRERYPDLPCTTVSDVLCARAR